MSPEPNGPAGVLVLVVGPSGAGKDSIMRRAGERLGPASGISFPRRVVTRPADGSEDNDAVTPERFAEAAARGDFILDWEAHGLRYGVPRHALDGLADGRVVVVNGSRSIVGRARDTIACVRVALVTAPAAVLEARILARGRDGDLLKRLSRDTITAEQLQPDVVIDNGGPLEAAVVQFVAFVRALQPSLREQVPAGL